MYRPGNLSIVLSVSDHCPPATIVHTCLDKNTVWKHYNTSASDFTSVVLIRVLPGAPCSSACDFTSVVLIRTLPGTLVLPVTSCCFAKNTHPSTDSSTKLDSLENNWCSCLLHN